MRDIILILFLAGLLPVSLKRPFVGALTFAFISLASPHRFTWGFAYSMPWAMLYAATTMLGLLMTRERMIGDSMRRYLPMLMYLAWTTVTTIFAIEHDYAVERWIEVAKIHLMCLVTLSLLTKWDDVKLLVWVTVCSVSFYGLKGGAFTLVTGGDYLVWGPPQSAIQDNNHLAVGLVMMLPMMYWLYAQSRSRWVAWIVLFSAAMTAVSILGSHSRSAFLGIIAMSVFLVLKSQHKFALMVVTVTGAAAALAFMPDSYWSRMATIETYQQDASAMGRLNVWRTAVNIANDRLTGAGFEYYTPTAFNRYAPVPEDIHSSHSIYFQALGEHGWIGLAMYLFIWAYVWLVCRRIAITTGASDEGRAQALLAQMVQTSLVGLAVGGAFVNVGNWDMLYYLAITALATARVLDSLRAGVTIATSRRNPFASRVRWGPTGAAGPGKSTGPS